MAMDKNMPMHGGPGGDGKKKSKNPDMYGHKGLAGAYGLDKRTTSENYGKGSEDRKDFYW